MPSKGGKTVQIRVSQIGKDVIDRVIQDTFDHKGIKLSAGEIVLEALSVKYPDVVKQIVKDHKGEDN